MAENRDYPDIGLTGHAPIGLAFWTQWVLATTVGSLLGLVGAVAALFVPVFVLAFFGSFETPPFWLVVLVSAGSTVGGAAMGIAIGTSQRLVLRHHVLWAERWMIATGIGWAVSTLVVAVFYMTLGWGAGAPLPLTLAIHGALVGFVQWCVVRQWVSRAAWWVLASTVGLYSLGTITGGVLVWLLRQPVPPGGDEK